MHAALCTGVSLIAMLAAGVPAGAGGLRDRNVNASAATAATAAAQAGAQAAAAAASQAMSRVNNSLQAMRNQQAAARAAAQAAASTVPNGLAPGGLVVAPGATPSATNFGSGLWQGADLPAQRTLGNGRTEVEVKQTDQKAILTWQSFNVGRETDLYFNQTAGGANAANWVALNRVIDPTASPSRILGTIKAEGQVYIINRNGIIFGGSSQVNVNSLVASSLSLSNQQFKAGLSTQLYGPVGGGSYTEGLPTFGDVPQSLAVNAPAPPVTGNVVVQAGAQITSAENGLIGLFGTNVTNSGILATDGGQVLLAAGEQVRLYPHTSDVGMVGMRAYVSALPNHYEPGVGDDAYFESLIQRTALVGMVAKNDGMITAESGNVTVVGSQVLQNGVVRAVTTLKSPGTIMIAGEDSVVWSQYGAIKRRGGTVVFGADSVTQVVVDREGGPGTGGSAGNASALRISGMTVELKGKAGAGQDQFQGDQLQGAYLQAEAGLIDVDLRGVEYVFASLGEGFGSQPTTPVAGTRLLVGAGAMLDVSGVRDAEVPMERNSVEVELRANELRDAPLQRGGFLQGKKIWVDRRITGRRADGSTWRGTALADANEYIANVPTSMAERAVKGGRVVVHSAEAIVMPGATIDISGGSIRYLDGTVRTTVLRGADGRIYDVGVAPADMIYVGEGAGFSRSHVVSLHGQKTVLTETWISQLRRGGLHFEKGYVEGASAGTLEVHAPAQVLDGVILAHAITGERQAEARPAGGSLKIGSTSLPDSYFHADDLLLQARAPGMPDGFSLTTPLSADRKKTLTLSTDMLNDSGLGKIEVYVNGNITLAHDADIRLQPGSLLTLYNGQPNKSAIIDGSIRIAGGSVNISVQGTTTVKAGAVIDVSGLWTNHLMSPGTTIAVDGGRIELGGTLVFENGSMLDVSAGARMSALRAVKIGKAGTILLNTKASRLDLAPVTLRGFGVAFGSEAMMPAGGELQLNVGSLLIASERGAAANATLLDPAFFGRGGFSSFVLTAGTVTIADGVTLAPAAQTLMLGPGYLLRPSADKVGNFASAQTVAAERRRGSAITLTSSGDVVLPAATSVVTGVGGRFVLTGRDVTLRGSIDAQAGDISVTGTNLTVASSARLLALGAARITTDASGLRRGTVLNGGNVSLTARDRIEIEAGALIDVSGTSGVIDVRNPAGGRRNPYQALEVASNGGSISISAARGTVDGTFVARAGGPSAVGGSLSVSMVASGGLELSVPSPRDWMEQFLASLDPNCWDGSCVGTWQGALGFDYGVVMMDWGYEYVPIIFTQALVDAMPSSLSGNIVLSKTGAAESRLNPADYGLSDRAIEIVAEALNWEIPLIFQPIRPLNVRPASFQSGGFAGLSLAGASVELDGVNLSMAQSITIGGSLINRNGTSSRLSAPAISIGSGGLAVPASPSTAGQLELSGSLVDIGVASVRGYSQTRIEASQLRMAGSYGSPSRLETDGALVIAAGQIFPTTQTDATITAVQSITILPNGSVLPPLSAGGMLTLKAPVIEQYGTLRAPFGQIVLEAGDTLTLGAGSITSTSGAGLTVPYGMIADQVRWHAGDANNPLTAPPDKRITLKAPTVDMKSGATIDLSGGGDLLAYQFIPGSGGSSDYLTYGNAVAILPVGQVPVTFGDQIIRLTGGNGIPAGDYVVMPASYALLPGAYRLQAMTGKDGQPIRDVDVSVRMADGSVLMSGWSSISGSGIHDPRSQAYLVSAAETIRLRSEYKVWTANDYFSSDTFVEAMRRHSGLVVTAVPRLPRDAGVLQIEATLSATLNATLRGAAEAGGRGAAIDISAAKVAVVGGVDAAAYRAAGYLVLDSAALSAFGGESLLLGGVRRQTVRGFELDATAGSVVIANDGTAAQALVAPEVLLASEDTIEIADGSRIEARGVLSGAADDILIKPALPVANNPSQNKDYGALVRVATGPAVGVVRENAQRSQGTLTIGAATLVGDAITLDATRTTSVSARAALLGRVLDISSGRVSVGTPTGTPDGLVLSGASLTALMTARELRLRSYTSIDFYGDVALGHRADDGRFTLASLLLDAAALNGASGAHVTVAAGDVTFVNTRGTATSGLGGVGGTLAVIADTVSLGAGSKTVDGFGRVEVSAASSIVARGTGSIDFRSANVAFTTPLLTATSGASQDWTTSGTFALAGTPSAQAFDTLGARLAITAASITQASAIDLTAGSLTLRATAGDVILAAGSVTRAAGFTRAFFDQQVDFAGGTVALVADQGRVRAEAGSLIDVSHSGSGAAGTLSLAATQQQAQLDGTLKADGGGNFSLDTSSIGSFAALADKLAASGFDGSLSIRLRAGDITLDGVTRASSVSIAADAGSITVSGTIDASGVDGGTIRLLARNDLTVTGGARLLANAGAADKRSGLIELSAANGTMRLQAGTTIEARGGRSGDGEIRLRFLRDDVAGTVKLSDASATMTARRILAEAYRTYATTSVDTTLPTALTDAAAFMSAHASAIEAGLGRAGDATFHLVPGIELQSSGDLTLSAATSLAGARYNGEAGVLTLRAGGNLLLNGSLSDGFSGAAANAAVLTDPASWSYRLVGGAELAAADPLAVRPLGALSGGGDVRLGTGVIVRTGTGSIEVAAGKDVVLADKTAVIYTAGARIADPSLGGTYTGNSFNPAFTSGGGRVSVSAQNDVRTTVASDQLIADWFWWQGASNTAYPGSDELNDGTFLTGHQTAWWINFATFRQGIAALGGGDLTLTAGRDIVNVSASTPTQGRVGGGRTAAEGKTVAITGGGDLTVRAGRDLVGGSYFVDQGTGTITAGGAVTSNRTALYDPDPTSNMEPSYLVPIRTVLALGDASLTVTAGGAIDISGVGNPTRWIRSKDQMGSNDARSTFSTYGENSALTLQSVGGDVTLWNAATHLAAGTAGWSDLNSGNPTSRQGAMAGLVYYPARTRVVAAAGDITVMGGMVIAPSATGNLDLWAQDSVTIRISGGDNTGRVDGEVVWLLMMSGADPDVIGTVLRPLAHLIELNVHANMGTGVSSPFSYTYGGQSGDYRPRGLLHADDHEPSRIYANAGDITIGYPGGVVRDQFYSEQVQFRAGRDINNVRARVQNNHASDVTVFAAGRDVNLSGGRISVDGPGFVLAEAGRDVFLGRGQGIETTGNGETPAGTETLYANPFLPKKGADLIVLAGTADGPRYDDFAAAYLDPTSGKSIYADDLVAFMRQVTRDPALSEAAAFAALNDPRYADYRKILTERVLSRELRAAGRGQLDGLGDQGGGYERGYKAMATLYPGAEKRDPAGWDGDVIMEVSVLRTYRGGDLGIVAPGGMLQVSALSSNAVGERNGVLTINGGEIRIATGAGTIINKSRVLTARGGDITIWSTFGDIDAGKGRKSALTTPPRTYKLTVDGNINYETNPSFSGSGISTQKGTLDAAASDVDLYAPNGIINAGDAGIRVSGNLYLGAIEIRGADNIQAGGEVKGLPKKTESVAPLSVETKDKAAADAVRDATQVAPTERPSVIIVEILGYGGGDPAEPKPAEEERDRRADLRGQDPRSRYQVVGVGALTDEEASRLADERRRQLGR